MTSNLTVSVIIPVKNGEKFISDAIRSIGIQKHDVKEIHVIDDGSTDKTRELVEGMAVKNEAIIIHDGPQRGPGPARNVGIKHATGDVISFLDCDDMWPEYKLEKQLARMEAKPEVMIVSGRALYFIKQEEDGLQPDPDARTEEFFHVHLGASIYRKTVFERLGGFDENFMYAEDVDLMLRIREAKLPFSILDLPTLYYRRHDNSMTTTVTPREKRDFNMALFNSMRRRKAAGETEPLKPFSDFVGY